MLSTNIDEQKEDTGECGQQIPSSVACAFIPRCNFFLALERQKKEGLFGKLQKKPTKLMNL